MRILNPQSLISLDELGLRKDLEQIFKHEISKPNGMIIVTGPTGSGKTTTLYAFLKQLRDPSIKIVTIEDPIEYHLEGITQTQVAVKKGYTFASGLKSIVRQDPDVILVGEIRDLETTNIGIQAALTGHLVLSTLHTNDAAGAIPRMEALGEQAFNIAPALNIIIAQRLIRKACPKCSQARKITEEELNIFKQELTNLEGVEVPEFNENTEIVETVGCPHCNNTGYKGRVGIFEALVVDDEMEDFILTNPSSVQLEKKAIEKGMTTMKQDGLIKILEKKTTFKEVNRVTL
jgi:type II secretory ATPase GspE/PulE/Tfp pilus assembly ATPase PilB-like protein